MSDSDEVIVQAINITKRLAVAEQGIGDIRCFLDDEGEETDEAPTETNSVMFAVIEWRFGGWTTVEVDDYETSEFGLN